MTTDMNEPREALTLGVREDQAAGGGRSAVTVAQPTTDAREGLSARPLELVTRGDVEYLAYCPGCTELHRHRALGDVRAPCGARYELLPRQGGPDGK